MSLRIFALSVAAAAAASFAAEAQPSSVKPMSFPVVQGKTYKFEKIADGVYYATGGFGSNNVVIVNDNDVMLVDAGTTPGNARRFVADVKMLTNKPIRYVVNTHFHFDHTDGNQIFGPDVQIIGQEYLAKAINPGIMNQEPYVTSTGAVLVAQMDDLKKQIAAEKDAGKKAALNKQLADAQLMQQELKELKPTPPNKTYKDKLVINSGGRGDRSALPRARTYRRRYGRLSAQGEDRRHRRSDGKQACLYGQCHFRRMDRHAGQAQEARFHRRSARPRHAVRRQGPDHGLSGLSPRPDRQRQ